MYFLLHRLPCKTQTALQVTSEEWRDFFKKINKLQPFLMPCLRDWNFTILALENIDNIELQEILGLERFGPHSKL